MSGQNPLQQIAHAFGECKRAYGELRADYAGARPSRFRRQRSGLGGHADAHLTDQDLWELRETSRDMDRNDTLVGQLIDRATDNVVRNGCTAEPNTGDDGVNAELSAMFDDWADDPDACDASGRYTFGELQWFALRAVYADGDVFAGLSDGGAIDLIEGDRCVSTQRGARNLKLGVLTDDYNRPLEYWFSRQMSRFYHARTQADVVRQPVRGKDGFPNVLHLMAARRPTQTRGVPALTPVIDVCGMVEDLSYAELVKNQVVSCLAAALTKSADFQLGPRREETASDGSSETIEAIKPGMVMNLRKGEDVKMLTPGMPNPNFEPYMRWLITLVGLRLGLPLVMSLMDARETNFSGWRGAIEQARLQFRCIQTMVKRRLLCPVYRWKIRQFIADGKLTGAAVVKMVRDGSILRHTWHAPTWPYIDPLKDAQANQLRRNTLEQSPRGIAGELGRDHDDVVRETVEDNGLAISLAIEKAQEISDEHGVSVNWRDVLFLTRDQAGASVAATSDKSGPAAESKPNGGTSNADAGDVPNEEEDSDMEDGRGIRAVA